MATRDNEENEKKKKKETKPVESVSVCMHQLEPDTGNGSDVMNPSS